MSYTTLASALGRRSIARHDTRQFGSACCLRDSSLREASLNESCSPREALRSRESTHRRTSSGTASIAAMPARRQKSPSGAAMRALLVLAASRADEGVDWNRRRVVRVFDSTQMSLRGGVAMTDRRGRPLPLRAERRRRAPQTAVSGRGAAARGQGVARLRALARRGRRL